MNVNIVKKTYSFKASGDTCYLRRHAKQCTKKHGALDHRQFQISQNEIGYSTSSMSPFIYNQEFMREGLAGIVASVSLPLTFGEDPRIVHFMQSMSNQPFIEFLGLLLIMM